MLQVTTDGHEYRSAHRTIVGVVYATFMPSGIRHDLVIEGKRVTYWSYGAKEDPPLLMVHGFRGDHHGLEPLAIRVTHRNVIVPDLPGFGESEPLEAPHTLDNFGAWLRAFHRDVIGGEFGLLGHSFGSLVVARSVSLGLNPHALSLVNPISAPALQGPRGILTRLAILYYRAGASLPAPLAHLLLRNPVIVRVMSEAMAKTRDARLRSWIHQQHAQYFSGFSDRDSLLEAFTASVSHTVEEFQDAFTMPTQIIAGALDDITPLHHQLRLARSNPTPAKFHVIRNSGHLIHYEAPDDVAILVEQFLDREVVA